MTAPVKGIGRVKPQQSSPTSERPNPISPPILAVFGRWLATALDVVTALTPVALAGGVVVSAAALLSVAHPVLGWSGMVAVDAKALATGHLPYGDPAHQYVGLLYTPLYTGIFAALLRMKWWDGWGPLVSLASVATSLILIARLVPRSRSDRYGSILPIAAVVSFPLFCYTLFPTNGVFEARPDQLAWCFFLAAACLVVRDYAGLGEPRPWRTRMATGLLLALSVLTKQTTLLPCLTTAAAAAALPFRHRSRAVGVRRHVLERAPIEAATLGVLLGGALGVLQIASGGFAYDLMFGLPQRQGKWNTLRGVLRADVKLLAVPLVIGSLVVAISLIPRLIDRLRHRRQHPTQGDPAPITNAAGRGEHVGLGPVILALTLAVSTLPGTMLAQAKQGGDTNNLAGPIWAATLVLAAVLMVSTARSRRIGARAVCSLIVIASLGPMTSVLQRHRLGAPDIVLHHSWHSVPAQLVDANSANRLVLDWAHPSYSITKSNSATPGDLIASDLASGGYSPRWFVQTVLDGRYSRVRLFPASWDAYASGYGLRDASFFWKTNYIVRAGYVPVQGFGGEGGFFAPGPALKHLQWLKDCFGPYQAGALNIAVRHGGGLWCVQPRALALLDGPAPTSELILRTSRPASFDVRFGGVAGTVTIAPTDSANKAVISSANDAVEISCDTRAAASPLFAKGFRVELDPHRRGISCSTTAGQTRILVGSTGGASTVSVSLLSDLASKPYLEHFSTGRASVQLKLHNPKPSELSN